MERAAARFWGTLTSARMPTASSPMPHGRPTHLWIAQRSFDKATDPGKLDNLIGGGVPDGQTPAQALVREGWEEAGLAPDADARRQRRQRAARCSATSPKACSTNGSTAYDLQLPPACAEQPGRRGRRLRMPAAGRGACSWPRRAMTVDAALVTLDFALRQRLLPPAQRPRLGVAMQRLRVRLDVQGF